MSENAETETQEATEAFWSQSTAAVLAAVDADLQGLSKADAAARRDRFGPNALSERRRGTRVRAFLSQFRSPIVLILLFAAGVAFFVGDTTTALITGRSS
ncbi:MAG: cation-transporting P-type ATPase [Haloarculaceae archaeon]